MKPHPEVTNFFGILHYQTQQILITKHLGVSKLFPIFEFYNFVGILHYFT